MNTHFEGILNRGRWEQRHLPQGEKSTFRDMVMEFIRDNGEEAMRVISIYAGFFNNSGLMRDVFLALGSIQHETTYAHRLHLIKYHLLVQESPEARKGAALALLAMGDPDALPALTVASKCEASPEVQAAIRQAIDHLHSVK